MMNKTPWAMIAIAATLMMGGCGKGDSSQPPLAGATMGGAFALTGEDGRTVRDTDFKGKYRLVYFGYTFCPDVCPVDVQKLMLGLKAFEKQDAARAAKIQPLFISVDPERDTPPALTQFTDAFHPRLIGLTGPQPAVMAAARAYGIYFQKAPSATPGSYLVDHSRAATLYGPNGEPIAFIPEQGTPEEIAHELGRWVK